MKGGFRNMKIFKSILAFLIYYFLGYLIFNTFIYITQLLIYLVLKIDLSLVDSYIQLFKDNLIIYTVIYIIILIAYFIYNILHIIIYIIYLYDIIYNMYNINNIFYMYFKA